MDVVAVQFGGFFQGLDRVRVAFHRAVRHPRQEQGVGSLTGGWVQPAEHV